LQICQNNQQQEELAVASAPHLHRWNKGKERAVHEQGASIKRSAIGEHSHAIPASFPSPLNICAKGDTCAPHPGGTKTVRERLGEAGAAVVAIVSLSSCRCSETSPSRFTPGMLAARELISHYMTGWTSAQLAGASPGMRSKHTSQVITGLQTHLSTPIRISDAEGAVSRGPS
jgi:hypothetical protein